MYFFFLLKEHGCPIKKKITLGYGRRHVARLCRRRRRRHRCRRRFSGVKFWNSIEDSLKSKSRTCFKISIKESLISNY